MCQQQLLIQVERSITRRPKDADEHDRFSFIPQFAPQRLLPFLASSTQMHLPGKLLSTLSIALLLRCNAMSTATATLTPHLRSSIGGRSDEDGRSLRALDSARESSEPDEARTFGKISSFLGNMKSSSRSSSIPKSVVLEPPKLSKEQLKKLQHQEIILRGAGTTTDKDFDAWLKELVGQSDFVQYRVFKEWSSKNIYPQKLGHLLDDAGVTRTQSLRQMLGRYWTYYNDLSFEKKLNAYARK